MSDNVLHSSGSDSWLTPPDICQRVTRVLGKVDVDPCSPSDPSISHVGAGIRLTEKEDSLSFSWASILPNRPLSVFCNPPGGKVGNRSKPVLFWERLCEFKFSGNLSHAIFLGFSIEFLQVSQSCTLAALDLPFCIPKQRIRFLSPDGSKKFSPTHGNVLVYVPGILDYSHLFYRTFEDLGRVVIPLLQKA